MKYKLLATDLDGTFLNNNAEIPTSNKLAVNQLIKNGVHFVIVTGRAMPTVEHYINELTGINYAILLNGAEIRNLKSGEIIYEKKLDKSIAQTIRQECCSFDVEIIMFNSNTIYIEQKGMHVYDYVSRYSLPYEILTEDISVPVNLSKVLVVGEHTVLKNFEKKISPIVKDSVNMFYSNPSFLEFTNKEIDKGKAVSILSKMLDIQIDEVICVGDNFNDASMLKVAGLSVAPYNAEPEIKSLVKYVAKCSNNEGVINEIANTFFGV